MNGISSNLADEIKKSGDRKNKEKFKFLAAVLVTNIMVAILCRPSGETKPEIKKDLRLTHAGHQMMVVPLNVLVTETSANLNEIPVSLVSRDKKVIVEKAWLHEVVKTEGEIPQFKIEINNEDVVRVSEFVSEGMVAVPYVQKKKNKLNVKRGSRYEVSI